MYFLFIQSLCYPMEVALYQVDTDDKAGDDGLAASVASIKTVKTTQIDGKASRDLAPIVRDMLVDTDVDIKDLAFCGMLSGPGSFTGLRIGYAFLEGICFGGGKLVGFTQFDYYHWLHQYQQQVKCQAQAQAQHQKQRQENIMVLLDSTKPSLWYRLYAPSLAGGYQEGSADFQEVQQLLESLGQKEKGGVIVGSGVDCLKADERAVLKRLGWRIPEWTMGANLLYDRDKIGRMAWRCRDQKLTSLFYFKDANITKPKDKQ